MYFIESEAFEVISKCNTGEGGIKNLNAPYDQFCFFGIIIIKQKYNIENYAFLRSWFFWCFFWKLFFSPQYVIFHIFHVFLVPSCPYENIKLLLAYPFYIKMYFCKYYFLYLAHAFRCCPIKEKWSELEFAHWVLLASHNGKFNISSIGCIWWEMFLKYNFKIWWATLNRPYLRHKVTFSSLLFLCFYIYII